MKRLYIAITIIIFAVNLVFLVYLFPHLIRVNDSKFESVVVESRVSAEKLEAVCRQMLLDYPNLPGKVRKILEVYPSLASQRIDAVSGFANSNRIFINNLFLLSFIFVIWGAVTTIVFWRTFYRSGKIFKVSANSRISIQPKGFPDQEE